MSSPYIPLPSLILSLACPIPQKHSPTPLHSTSTHTHLPSIHPHPPSPHSCMSLPGKTKPHPEKPNLIPTPLPQYTPLLLFPNILTQQGYPTHHPTPISFPTTRSSYTHILPHSTPILRPQHDTLTYNYLACCPSLPDLLPSLPLNASFHL